MTAANDRASSIDSRVDNARERLAALEVGVQGLKDAIEALTRTLEKRRADIDRIEGRLWKISVAVAVIAGGMGAGGQAIVKALVG